MHSTTQISSARGVRLLGHLAAALLFVFVAATPRDAQAQAGRAGVVFLMIEPDSRGAGMGNTGVALADNANATFWNPAGLAFQSGSEVGLTHSPWLSELDAGLFYDYVVGKYHWEGVGTFAGHVSYLFMGEHEQRDRTGTAVAEFSSNDLAVGGSFGFNVTEQFAMGVGARYIHSDLASGIDVGTNQTAEAGRSIGLDLAGLYRAKPFDIGSVSTTLSAGFNLANMGPSISYTDTDSTASPIPTTLRMGFAGTFQFDDYNRLTLATDLSRMMVDTEESGKAVPFYEALFSSWKPVTVDVTNERSNTLSVMEQFMVGVGAEYWYDDLLALRSGYFYEHPDNGGREFLTFGAGIRYNIVGVDFSYLHALEQEHPLSGTMRFSLLLSL